MSDADPGAGNLCRFIVFAVKRGLRFLDAAHVRCGLLAFD